MKPNPPRTSAEKQAALEERDRRRRQLEAAWVLVQPALDRAGYSGRYTTTRRDRRIVLVFGGRTPVEVRPLLGALGVSELFSLEVDDDDDDEVWTLGKELQEVLERAGFESHRFGLNEDGTGPVIGLTAEPDSEEARRADAICTTFAAARQCGAEWEYDPLGPFTALPSRPRQNPDPLRDVDRRR